MQENKLTKEQQQQFMAFLNEYEKCRNLSKEEKENLIVQITSTTYIDLLCDWALSSTCDKAHYHKHIVMRSGRYVIGLNS